MSSDFLVQELLDSGDLILVQDGNHGGNYPKSEEFIETGVPLITGACIEKGAVDYSKALFLNSESANRLRVGKAKPGDVILSHKGSMGKTAIIPGGVYQETILNPQLTLYRVNPNGKLINKYLKYYFDSPFFQEYLVRISSTSTINTLSISSQKKLRISIPSIDVQRSIVNFLGLLDDRITLLRASNTTLEAIAQALFKSWFVDFDPIHAKQQGRAPEGMDAQTAALFPDSFEESELGMVPKGWSPDWLSNMMDFKEGPGIRNWQYTNTDEGTRFINIRCIQDGDLSLENANRIHDDEANGKYAHFHLNEWDVVVSTSGTLGRSAIVRKEHLPLMLNTSVIRFRSINGVTEFGFLFNYLNSSEFLYKLESMASGSVQKNFGPMHLKQIKIIKPNFDVVRAYENISKPIFEKILENRSKAQNLTLTRDTLLPRLISGQLRLPEAQTLVEDAVDA